MHEICNVKIRRGAVFVAKLRKNNRIKKIFEILDDDKIDT